MFADTRTIHLPISDVVGLREVNEGLLHGSLEILGVPHHVQLIEVTDDRQHVQRARHLQNSEHFDAINEANPERLETVEFRGRRYVVHIYPHAE